MSRLPAIRHFLPLAALLAAAGILLSSMASVQAQQAPADRPEQGSPNGYSPHQSNRDVGFYSLRLSDVWGPAQMPPAPKDFGPHFDFPPEPLNGAPLHDPYPN